ncbi:MAG: tetratricopeptide repeat protein [Caulobacter sp.]|nr:tetratricopeptide repeat protein [Caulobacter sp.]
MTEHLERGVEAHRAGHLDEAESHYLALLARQPDHAQTIRLLGLLRQTQGRLAEAVALLARAAALLRLPVVHGELAAVLTATGAVLEAAEASARARPDGGHPLIRALLARAAAICHEGRADEAVRLSRMALVLAPGPDGSAVLAACLLVKADSADAATAINLCRLALRLHPLPAAHSRLLALLYPIRPSEAMLHGLKAFQLDPNPVTLDEASMIIVRLLVNGRQAPEGLPAYIDAMGEGNYRRSRNDPAGAEAFCRKAAVLEPGLPFAHARLGHLAALGGRLEEADEHLRRADRHGPARESVMRFGTDFMNRLEASPLPGPPVAGELPDIDAPLVVLSSCDSGYFDRFAEPFARTLAETAGLPVHLHLHLIGDEAGRARELVRRAGLNSAVVTTQPDRAPGGGKERSTYYACQRFLLLPHLLRHYRRPVLLLDIDLVVLRPLGLLLDMAGTADLAAVGGQPDFETWNQLWADVLLWRPTAAGLAFADLTARYVGHFLDRGLPRWFLDQIALFAAWRSLAARGSGPRLTLLPSLIHRDGMAEDDPRRDACLFWSIRASTGNPS